MKLELDGLTKEFGDFTAVNHIDLTMTNGVYGLLGVNGAGKTTILHTITGLLSPKRGSIQFEGKELTDLEKYEIIDIISETTNLNIICIAEDDPKLEERMNQSLINKLNELNHKTGQFYKGNLRNGQVMDFETSIIIIGNVYEGAQIVSKGNIIVLGELSGSAFAGAGGNPSSFVAALSMNPTQIRICDTIYKAPDKKKRFRKKYGTQIAVCENGVIYRKSITQDLIADIKLD